MVEHFQAVTRHKIGGRAKAMVVTGSRLEAVRYKQSFDRYIQEKGYAIKSLVAFSGTVVDDRLTGVTYTEPGMNHGISEKELPEKFATGEYQVLLVAEKYQTGFDQPLLHTMFVDKRLAGIQAVQTLFRLNRIHPLKEDTFVLDFVNDTEENPRSLQDLLRRRRDGRGSRPRPHVRNQGRAGCFRNLHRRGDRTVQRRLLHTEAAAECIRSPHHERGSRPGGVAFHRPPGRQRGGGGRLAQQGAGVLEPVWVP